MNTSKKKKMQARDTGGISVLEAKPDFPSNGGESGGAAAATAIRPQPEIAAPPPAAVWQRNQRVTGLWGKDRNFWVAIRGIGWKKLANASDSANLTLTLLATQALQTDRPVDYREDADGMIHEIYVW
jgi:hypothetical protein